MKSETALFQENKIYRTNEVARILGRSQSAIAGARRKGYITPVNPHAFSGHEYTGKALNRMLRLHPEWMGNSHIWAAKKRAAEGPQKPKPLKRKQRREGILKALLDNPKIQEGK